MRRRRFIKLIVGSAAVGALGCSSKVGDGAGPGPGADAAGLDTADGSPGSADAGLAPVDASVGCDAQTVLVYDTYAQALYLDGTYGPLTGVIAAESVRDGVALQMDFWHGHGGQVHQFTVTPADFEALARGEKVYIETTEVEDHMHTLFIDPSDPQYRVPDTDPVSVSLGDC